VKTLIDTPATSKRWGDVIVLRHAAAGVGGAAGAVVKCSVITPATGT